MNVLLLVAVGYCAGLHTDKVLHVVLQLKDIFHPGFVCLLLSGNEECEYRRSTVI
jgi:hypothetical protein